MGLMAWESHVFFESVKIVGWAAPTIGGVVGALIGYAFGPSEGREHRLAWGFGLGAAVPAVIVLLIGAYRALNAT